MQKPIAQAQAQRGLRSQEPPGIAINFGHGATERGYEIVLQRLPDGEIDADAIITGRVGLDGVGDAVAALRSPDEHVKIMVLPKGTRDA